MIAFEHAARIAEKLAAELAGSRFPSTSNRLKFVEGALTKAVSQSEDSPTTCILRFNNISRKAERSSVFALAMKTRIMVRIL